MRDNLKACPVEDCVSISITSKIENLCDSCPNRRTPDTDATLEALAVEVESNPIPGDAMAHYYAKRYARIIRAKKGTV